MTTASNTPVPPHPTDEATQLLCRHFRLLLEHGEYILRTPEMAECPVPTGISYGPVSGSHDLAALLQRWLSPESPWIYRKRAKSYYMLRAVYGVGGCCYHGCGIERESGALTTGLTPRGLALLKFRPPLPRAPRRPLPAALLQGMRKPHSSFAEWEKQTSTEEGLRSYMMDPTRRIKPPTMSLADIIAHLQETRPLIVNIPHASAVLPPSVRFMSPAGEMKSKAQLASDLFADTLLQPQIGLIRVKAGVSRLVADTALSPEEAVMPDTTEAEKQELLRAYYFPHQELLTMHCTHSLRRHGSALMLHWHSHPGSTPADICIGTADGHTPANLSATVQACCRAFRLSVCVAPHAPDSMVPAGFTGDSRFHTIRVSIRRDLYLNEEECRLHNGAPRIQAWAGHLAAQLLRTAALAS